MLLGVTEMKLLGAGSSQIKFLTPTLPESCSERLGQRGGSHAARGSACCFPLLTRGDDGDLSLPNLTYF